MLATIRRLRHGPLQRLGPLWLFLGRRYRWLARQLPGLTVRQKIGTYGPYCLLGQFAFTDFEGWGAGHNRAFSACVEACRGKTCVLDVGAHIGLVSLPIASILASDSTLVAFEPAEANEKILRRHLQLNGFSGVNVVRAVVGAEDRDMVAFYESIGVHGQNSIILKSETTLRSEVGGYQRTLPPQISLDSYCSGHNLKPDVIKIDVEGSELNVLRGARFVLREYRPLLILSVHPRELSLAGQSVDELKEFLDLVGYEISDVDGKRVTEFHLDEYLVHPKE